jgi:hypothetical protein
MSDIEKWLKDTSLELNRKIQGGFPSDVDGELKWNKVKKCEISYSRKLESDLIC